MTGAEILRCHVDQEHFQLQSIALFCSLCSSFSSRAALRLVELLICISAWLTACFATNHDGKGHRNVHVGTVIFSCEWLGCASLEANEELQSALTVPRSAMSEINDALPSHSDTTCRISRQPCIKSRGSERSRRWYSRMHRRTRSPILESLYNARPMRVLSVLSTEVHAANGGFICSHSALYPWYTG